jgi:hypothetical protein
VIRAGARAAGMRNQAFVSLALTLLALAVAWEMGGWIAAGTLSNLTLSVVGLVVVAIGIAILRNWRNGFYLFIVWLLFEDLIRKYLGNNMYIYFAKDVLAGLTYVSLYVAIRRGRERIFRPPFLFVFSLFFWLGTLQVFNPLSPSILYGLMGLKIYFYYVPLMFLGYALLRDQEDLQHFLMVNLGLASVISALGIIQAIRGPGFLNPAVLAPEIRELGALEKVTPISHAVLSLPTATFVSSGRFGWYLIFAVTLSLGSAGYLLLHTKRGRKLAYVTIALVSTATMLSGSRGTVVFSVMSALVLGAGFLWGAPWRWRQAHRLAKAIRRSFVAVSLGLAALVLIFPASIGTRWAYYSETLNPDSPSSELANRAWDYPMLNLSLAFTDPHWITGNGIGTASLGVQYVSALLHERPPNVGVESGYGTLIVELGILGPVLWIVWTVGLMLSGWKVVRRLKETSFFPLAFSILWLAFMVLFLFTYGTLAAYENFVLNAYLWVLIGLLYRLPSLLSQPQPVPSTPAHALRHGR